MSAACLSSISLDSEFGQGSSSSPLCLGQLGMFADDVCALLKLITACGTLLVCGTPLQTRTGLAVYGLEG